MVLRVRRVGHQLGFQTVSFCRHLTFKFFFLHLDNNQTDTIIQLCYNNAPPFNNLILISFLNDVTMDNSTCLLLYATSSFSNEESFLIFFLSWSKWNGKRWSENERRLNISINFISDQIKRNTYLIMLKRTFHTCTWAYC